MRRVVLFDFHNTLATCDRWLELEIRLLPGLALTRLAGTGELPAGARAREEEAQVLFRRLRAQVRESGVELSAVEGTRRVLEQMGYAPPEAALEAVVARLEEDCLRDVRAIPGADHAVWTLRDWGYRLGVVSSAGYPPFVEMALEELGLRGAFSEVVTSAGEGIYKSDPEIYRRAAARLGTRPEESTHVGDHPLYDVRAARDAGMATVWVTREARRTAHLHSAPWDELAREGALADAVVDDIGEVPGAIQRLSERL